MNLVEALGWAASALEIRADQWHNGYADDTEIIESDREEQLKMAHKYKQALARINEERL